jgi:pimeloyl-ACP methyl ester carboxylesterase
VQCAGAETRRRRFLILGALSIPFVALADSVPPAAGKLQNNVVFTEYSPLSASKVLATRLLSPLTAKQMLDRAANSGIQYREQGIDLGNERFSFFAPSQKPEQGYALLVFIPPWQSGTVPPAWIPALERRGMIFVTAANSGNPEDVFTRRVPLALLAAHNIMQRYPVDRDRVYIGGMSGGSRVALRMALSFPDVFRGALLHSGSDPIGGTETPLPAAALFRRFQESTRLVYITGQNDRASLDKDDESRSSLRDWCAFDFGVENFAFGGHELAGVREFERSLAALGEHAPTNLGKLADCREKRDKEIAAKLKEVQSLIDSGKTRDARALLKKTDAHFAGLAAPASVELAEKMAAER